MDTDICYCMDPATGDIVHMQIYPRPHMHSELMATSSDFTQFNGDFEAWFTDLITFKDMPVENDPCWCQYQDKVQICHSWCADICHLVISIPVILIMELSVNVQGNTLPWDIPSTLNTACPSHAKKYKMMYDLVGHGLKDPSKSHFIACYLNTHDHSLYTYNNLCNNGRCICTSGAKISLQLAGTNPPLPNRCFHHIVVYQLHGGLHAQEQFYHDWIWACYAELGIDFLETDLFHRASLICYVREDLSLMDPKYWVWTRFLTKTFEYVHPSLTHVYPKLPDQLSFLIELSAMELEDTDKEEKAVVESLKDGQAAIEVEQKAATSLIPQLCAWSTDMEHETQSYGIHIQCCCGMTGDYDEVHSIHHGQLVQCLGCLCHCHVICQQSPATHDTTARQWFRCHECALPPPMESARIALL